MIKTNITCEGQMSSTSLQMSWEVHNIIYAVILAGDA